MTLQEQIREIKKNLRGVMNGPVSQSMREKGLTYKVNFGVELPRLREMAKAWPHTYELAAALWKENIRECRLLAGMLMPTENFPEDLADLWVEQMNFPEEAECTVIHLFARLPYASVKAFTWIAREEPMFRLCGWHLLSRLFMQGAQPAPRDAEEMLDQAASELRGNDLTLKRAAHTALLRFMNLGEEEEQQADKVLTACGL